MQQIISKIFEFNSIPKKQNVYGINNLVTQPEFRNPEKLKYVLSLLDNSSVWKQIAYTNEITGKSKITFVSDVDNKDVSDRFLTALILSLFVCLANIGLALFGFLLFRSPGDF